MIICFTVRFYNAFLFRFSFHYSRIFEKRFSRFPSPQWFIDPIMASPCISILRPPRAFPTIVTAPPLSPRANTRTTPLSAPCSKQGLTVNHDSLKCVLELWVLAGCLLERQKILLEHWPDTGTGKSLDDTSRVVWHFTETWKRTKLFSSIVQSL